MNLLKTVMNGPKGQIYEFGEFRLDVANRLLTKGEGEQIPLTPKVFDTLLYLLRHGGKVIAKDELMREIWTDSIVEENNLNQNISILRRVFGEKPGEQRFIVTVAGHGYRFVPEVRSLDLGFEAADSSSGAKGFEYQIPPGIALIYNALEMRDNVFEWLEKGYHQRDPKMMFLKVEPKWNILRSDPRFISLIKRMRVES